MPPELDGEIPAKPSASLLHNRDFVTFWAGETVSLTGVQISELALLLTAIVTLRASAFEIGLLNVARYAPFIVISLFAGVWFDRHRRRPVLIVCNLGRALIIGLVPLAALLGMLSINILYVIGLLLGTFTVVFDVGSLSYIPSLVDRHHLAEANSKIQSSYSLADIGGPGLAGLLVGLLTAPITLFVGSVTYLTSALSLILIGRREPEPEIPDGKPSIAASIGEGIRAVFGNPILKNLATQSAVFNLFENVMTTIFAVYAVRLLGLSAARLGLVLGAGAAGALAGALFSNRVTRVAGVGNALRISTLAGCLSPLLMLVPRGAGPLSLLILATGLAIHGANLAVFNVNALTLRQCATPARLLGRMNATYRLLLFGTVPLGALLGGALASAFGLRTALIMGVCGLTIPIAWIPFSPVFALRAMPDSLDRETDSEKSASSRTFAADPWHDSARATEDERRQAVQHIESGPETDGVTEIMYVDRRPVLEWWEKSRRGGLSDLSTKFASGRPTTLPDRQMLELRTLIIGNSPRQLGFDLALWTPEMIGKLIRHRFGVIVSRVTAGRILKKLGMYPQGPLHRAYQEPAEEMQEWREKTYPEIREEATRRGAEIFFADESDVRADFCSGATWRLAGQAPVVTTAAERQSIMMVSAISPREELRFNIHQGIFRPSDFIDFCKQLMQDTESDIFLIVDRISVHTSGETREFVRSTGGKLRLFFLPSYSPELNYGERLPENVKHHPAGRAAVRGADDLSALERGAPEASPENASDGAWILCRPEVVINILVRPCLHQKTAETYVLGDTKTSQNTAEISVVQSPDRVKEGCVS